MSTLVTNLACRTTRTRWTEAASTRVPARPAVSVRTPEEIDLMRRAGRVVRAALDAATRACLAGETTARVDAVAAGEIARHARHGASPLFLDHPADGQDPGCTDDRRPGLAGGFPATTCISVNEEVVHGIPGSRVLREGDLVTVDCGASVDGWCADAAVTVAIGRIAADRRHLLETTCALLDAAIGAIRPGIAWSRIAARLQAMADAAGLNMVTEYVGHGIGRRLHEAPEVPCHAFDPSAGRDFTLRPGMTLAIEPMLVLGSARTVQRDDGWTVATADGLPAAHVEHTVVVTRDGAEVLTGPLPGELAREVPSN